MHPVLGTLLLVVPLALAAQPRERVDSTLPLAPRAGERVVETRPLRDAGEARLREELRRARELEALSLPPAWGAGGPVVVYPQVSPGVPPCPGPGCAFRGPGPFAPR